MRNIFYALHHPEMFSSACSLSANPGPLTLETTRDQIKYFIPNADDLSDELIEDHFKQYSALNLINNIKDENKNAVRWFIDIGDDDNRFESNSTIHIAMRKKEIPHEYRVRNGDHNWTYWRESLPEVLKFVSDAFHQY